MLTWLFTASPLIPGLWMEIATGAPESDGQWPIPFQMSYEGNEQGIYVTVSAVGTPGTGTVTPAPGDGQAWNVQVTPSKPITYESGLQLAVPAGVYNVTVQQADANGATFGPIYTGWTDITLPPPPPPSGGGDGGLDPGGFDGGVGRVQPGHHPVWAHNLPVGEPIAGEPSKPNA